MSWLNELQTTIQDHSPACGLDRFAASLDEAWIDEALQATGRASIRRRKLPAKQVIWLVLGMALYTDRAIQTVLRHLGLVEADDSNIAPSAIVNARYRLGAEPLRWLFERVATAWADTPGDGGYRGLALYGVDGTTLRVQDSDENFDAFGKPGGRAGANDAGYPQLRLAALMNLENRMLVDARMGPYRTGEQTLARELWSRIPDDSITLLDRGLTSYMTMSEILGGGDNRHVLVRIKSDFAYEEVEELPDGSILALVHVPKNVRQVDPNVPGPIELRIIGYQHEGGEPSRIATSLLDHEEYLAEELVELYHSRWELEIGFDEIKTHMLERKECLRSKKPEGVRQEVWAQLLVYNLVRREMQMAAEAQDLPANRMSFRLSLLYIRDFWTTGWMVSPGNIPRTLADLRTRLHELVLPPRRKERRYPRHVKIKMSNYPRNRGRRSERRANPESVK